MNQTYIHLLSIIGLCSIANRGWVTRLKINENQGKGAKEGYELGYECANNTELIDASALTGMP